MPAPALPRQASWRGGFEITSDDELSAAVSYVVSKTVAAAKASCNPHPTGVTGGAVRPTNATCQAGAISCIGGCVDLQSMQEQHVYRRLGVKGV